MSLPSTWGLGRCHPVGVQGDEEALVDQAVAFSGRGHVAITDPVFQGTDGVGDKGEGLGRGGGTIPCAFKNLPSILTIGCGFASGISWKVLQQFCDHLEGLGMGKRSIEEGIKEGLSVWWRSWSECRLGGGGDEMG